MSLVDGYTTGPSTVEELFREGAANTVDHFSQSDVHFFERCALKNDGAIKITKPGVVETIHACGRRFNLYVDGKQVANDIAEFSGDPNAGFEVPRFKSEHAQTWIKDFPMLYNRDVRIEECEPGTIDEVRIVIRNQIREKFECRSLRLA